MNFDSKDPVFLREDHNMMNNNNNNNGNGPCSNIHLPKAARCVGAAPQSIRPSTIFLQECKSEIKNKNNNNNNHNESESEESINRCQFYKYL